MVTVLHLITGLDTGGAEMMLAKLIEGSDRERVKHVVVSLTNVGPVGRTIAACGVPVHSLQMPRGIPDPRAMWRLLHIMRRVEPDVVQTWLYHADLLGALSATLVGIPVVWNIRSTFNTELGRLLTGVARTCARLSRLPAAVVTNSEAAQALHCELGYRPRQWLVIPNGFDLQRLQPDPGARQAIRQELDLPPDAPLVGLIARYHPMKDHRTFLRAAKMLSQSVPEAHFLLVGKGVTTANTELMTLVASDGTADRVHLLGERSDIPTLTAALDIATCCSTYGESFPSTVGEAMACAVPCVVTEVGDAARIVGDTGPIVPFRNPPALARAWQALLELSPADRRTNGQRARTRVETYYSIDAVVQEYETLYERLAAQPGRKRGLASLLPRRPLRRSRIGSQPRNQDSQASMLSDSNVDARTVAGFGNEWTTFDQSSLSAAELDTLFKQYFAIFPWDALPADAAGFDLGCGSGRWARLVAPRVHHLHCVDPSPAALEVAHQNLADYGNCSFHVAAVDSIPLPDNSMDFGYSLGVLHHVPDTAAGIRSCVAKLKPGAPFLLYIYYAFDNRPRWFRLLWQGTDAVRRVVSALPYALQNGFSLGVAATFYWPLARAGRLLERVGINAESLPLSYYRHRSFYVIRTDARDRFGTSLEQRFTANQIRAMMESAGLERITFSPDPPYWCAAGFKRVEESRSREVEKEMREGILA